MSKNIVYTKEDLDQKSYVDLLKLAKQANIKLSNQKKPELINLLLGNEDNDDVAVMPNRRIAENLLTPFQKDVGSAFMAIRSKKTNTYRKNKNVVAVFEKYNTLPAGALEEEYNSVLSAYTDGQEFEVTTTKRVKTPKQPKPTVTVESVLGKLSAETVKVLENADVNKSTKMRRMFAENLSVKEVSLVVGCHYSFAYGVKKRFDADQTNAAADNAK